MTPLMLLHGLLASTPNPPTPTSALPNLSPLKTYVETTAGVVIAIAAAVFAIIHLLKGQLMKFVEFAGLTTLAVAFISFPDQLIGMAKGVVSLVLGSGAGTGG